LKIHNKKSIISVSKPRKSVTAKKTATVKAISVKPVAAKITNSAPAPISAQAQVTPAAKPVAKPIATTATTTKAS
jgi:hypothetical protein